MMYLLDLIFAKFIEDSSDRKKGYVNMFFDYLAAVFVSIILVVADALEGLANVLRRLTDDKKCGEDYVDIGIALINFKDKIYNQTSDLENKRMKEIRVMCSDLSDATQNSYPELSGVINDIQKYVSDELKGTMMRYVENYISKKEDYYQSLLIIWDGSIKNPTIKKEMKSITNDAELCFYRQLISKIKEEISQLKKEANENMEERSNDTERVS